MTETRLQKIIAILKQTDSSWHNIIETFPDFILVIDEQYKIQYINRMLDGYKRSDVMGQSTLLFIPESQHGIFKDSVDTVFETGELLSQEIKGYYPDGSEGWFASRYGPIYDRADIVGVIAISQDVSDSKKQQLRLDEKQKELNRLAKLTLAGGITSGLAHELNQPLSSIVNYAGGCIRRVNNSDIQPAELCKQLEKIQKLANQASCIIKDLQQFFMTGVSDKVVVDVQGVVAHAIELTQFTDVLLKVDYNACEGAQLVLVNQTLLVQVILYIINNAYEAMNQNGQTDMSIAINVYKQNNDIGIRIANNGPRVDPRREEKLFYPFVSTKRGNESIGMGLAVCHGIIEEHEGNIKYTYLTDALHPVCFDILLPKMD